MKCTTGYSVPFDLAQSQTYDRDQTQGRNHRGWRHCGFSCQMQAMQGVELVAAFEKS